MKIIAEFNSNEELLSFVNTFGATALQPTSIEVPVTKKEAEAPKEDKKTKKATKAKKEEHKAEPVEDSMEELPKTESVEDSKTVDKVEDSVEETPKEEVKEVTTITKEEVRAVFTKLLKAGKGKEAKELTAKYGASKLGELKEEDYAAVLKEAEELM